MGIREGTAREIAIISRVNKTVAFRIMDIARDGQDIVPILSLSLIHILQNQRRLAQKAGLSILTDLGQQKRRGFVRVRVHKPDALEFLSLIHI